jgi:hypothetical protein
MADTSGTRIRRGGENCNLVILQSNLIKRLYWLALMSYIRMCDHECKCSLWCAQCRSTTYVILDGIVLHYPPLSDELNDI